MTPIDRAARALCVAQGYPESENELARAAEEVRAVLQAIREPSEAMLDAGAEAPFSRIDHEDAEHLWQAMIDAALEEGKEPMP